MEWIKMLMDQLLQNHMLQGAVISLLISQLRKHFTTMDKMAKDPDQVKFLQMIIAGLSVAVTLLTAYLQGHTGTVDTKSLSDFITVVLAALGTHQLGKDVKEHVGK